jgi:hypothetical protein
MLKNEVAMLTDLHKLNVELMKLKQQKWDVERENLKEGKKNKIDYILFDLLKVSEANKEKLQRIKKICDE